MNSTDKNFDFLTVYITTKVVEWLIEDKRLGLEEAMLIFHNSETFDKLCDKSTGLYIESPAYIYEIFKEEQRLGTIRGLTE